jgi:hypothetical protein
MLNPFRSEDEAFRFLLRGVAVFAILIALILASRAIF